jgi:hypothetical protein
LLTSTATLFLQKQEINVLLLLLLPLLRRSCQKHHHVIFAYRLFPSSACGTANLWTLLLSEFDEHRASCCFVMQGPRQEHNHAITSRLFPNISRRRCT